MFGEMLGGNGYSGVQEWDWIKNLEEDLEAFGIKFEGWLARGRTEGRQMVPTGRRRGGGFHAEMAQGREEGSIRAIEDGCNRDSNRCRQHTRAGGEGGGRGEQAVCPTD